ncbi:heterokaryon incompatibility protein-domain-containing protein [Hypoxylon trugodes]|uniref:heterokaryon incompatibility protein-domain-containing protein n=1 Tax=Hypoxylon trugodes TaxID=326681 RepID=UPI0021A24DE7|nr:heterokaryon incompatibility protein-domain-containing protein [Hypoxylon trugodes]KAI1389509.1 heterokaryon incompatibility protein-domain-containing protein [Hypoxylon trugodes]
MEAHGFVSVDLSVQNEDNNAPGPIIQPPQLYDHLQIPSSGHHIRVLDLDGEPPQQNTGLKGSMRVVDLKTGSRFTALSYVWGAGSSAITCNGCEFPITDNGKAALLALRHLYGPITIWIDSICVNQTDDTEKTQQVAMMGDIYSRAETTFIWLGLGNPQLFKTIEALNEISYLGPHPAGFPWNKRKVILDKVLFILSLLRAYLARFISFRLFYPRVHMYLKAGWDDPHEIQNIDVQNLMACEWFSRAWTFQEFLLSPNPVFVSGDSIVSLANLKKVHDVATGGHWMEERSFTRSLLENKWRFTSRRWWSRTVHRIIDTSAGLWDLVSIWATLSRSTNNDNLLSGTQAKGLARDGCHRSAYIYRQNVVRIARLNYFASWLSSTSGLLFGYGSVLFALGYFFAYLVHFSGTNEGLILVVATSYYVMTNFAYRILVSCFPCFSHRRNRFKEAIETNYPVISGIQEALRMRKATRGLDKSFSMYGILRTLNAPCSEPNYQKTEALVFQELFGSLLRWDSAFIELLADAGRPAAGSPTWVPDCGKIRERTWLSPQYLNKIFNQQWSHGRLEDCIQIRGDEAIVRIKTIGKVTFHGGTLDSIDTPNYETEPIAMNLTQLNDAVSHLRRWLRHLWKENPVDQGSKTIPQMVLDVFSGRVRTNESPSGTVMGENYYEPNTSLFNKWYKILIQNLNRKVMDRDPSFTDRLKGNREVLRSFVDSWNALARKRSLIFSRDGFVGSGPPHVEAGDLVARVYGVSRPMIFRQVRGDDNTERYEVVGDAFICGYMEQGRYQPESGPNNLNSLVLI